MICRRDETASAKICRRDGTASAERPRRSCRSKLRSGLALALLVHLVGASGCGLVYRASRGGASFVLYSDRSDDFIEATRDQVEEIYSAYLTVFDLDRSDLGTTRIFLDGDDEGVIDHSYSPSLLGYYVPLFNVIRVDTEPAWARNPEALRQVLLHEISHLFVIKRFPSAHRECWLNEGLAGNLEVSLIEGRHAEFPLMHPALAHLAQKALSDPESSVSLSRLLDMGWGEFHSSEHKVTHYALSWSIVHFFLERELPAHLPLKDRIEELYRMDRKAIARRESAWRSFLENLDLTDYVIRLARSSSPPRRLSAEWAIRQMGELACLDDTRTLPVLVELIESARGGARRLACFTFLKVLDRNPHVLYCARGSALSGLDRIGALIGDSREDPEFRASLIPEIGKAVPASSRWVGLLVPFLEAEDPDLRAASAAALSEMATKPTIVNPEFWRGAPASARAREVGEWREWLQALEG